MTGTLLTNSRLNGLVPRREDLFGPFESYFDDFFNKFFSESGLSSVKGRSGYPKVDVIADQGKWIVEVAAPGVKKEDITVEILPYDEGRDAVKISGKMSEDRQYSDDAHYHVKELRRSSFERTLILPPNVEGEPEATMKDGIITLTWNVPEQKAPERKLIPIKD